MRHPRAADPGAARRGAPAGFWLVALFLLSRPPTRRLGLHVALATLFTIVAAHLVFRLAYCWSSASEGLLSQAHRNAAVCSELREASWPPGERARPSSCFRSFLQPTALRGNRRERWLVGAIVGLQLLYTAWVGADAWEGLGFTNRYVASVLPLLWALAALGVKEAASPSAPWVARVLSGAVLLRCVSLAFGDFVGVGTGGVRTSSDRLAA